MAKKVFVRTFGCQMNEYDSSKMYDVLSVEGFKPAVCAEEADIILFNTCSVREKAQEKTFSDLGRVEHLKAKNPDMMIGVGGCVASQEGERILERAPFVDLIFGPQTLHRLPKLISERKKTGIPQIDITFPEVEKFDSLPTDSEVSGVSSFVSIMEGCSKYCTFCVVPYTRGEEVSRPLSGIITEIDHLVSEGVREVTLLGQNVNAYRVCEGGCEIDFVTLLECISEINGIERIRFTTSHPVEFSDRLVKAYEYLPKLQNYVHLPVQSGSDRILMKMKRGYTVLEYKSIIRRLRVVRPDILISSDFIVSFPGETEDDFDKTMNLIKEMDFDFSFSFLYSPRPGTPAATLADDTPDIIKKQRLLKLQSTIDEQGLAHSQAMIGQLEWVLVEKPARRGERLLCGRTSNNRMVNFEGDLSLIGSFQQIKIVECSTYSLRGERVESEL